MTAGRRRRRLRSAVAATALLGVLVVANVAAEANDRQADLSAGRRFSLTDDTEAIVKAVDAPLEITAFLTDTGSLARDARFLLSRYRELNRRIDFSVIDPDAHPSTARRFEVTDYSTVVLQYRGRRVDAPAVGEVEVSSAILRLLRGGTIPLCLVRGHGEGDLSDDSPAGLSRLATLLEQNGYEVRLLDLALTGEVPGECRAVVVAGARVPLTPEEVDALAAYGRRAGRLLVLASPLSSFDPNPLTQQWGIAFLGGLVVDPARSRGLDLSDLVVEEFPSASPVVRDVPRLAMPVSGGVAVEVSPREGLTIARLAVTSGEGFVEADPDTEIQLDEGDVEGPVAVAAAADDSRVEESGESRVPGRAGGPRIVRTRVLVTGGAEWATNQFLDELGNRRFMLNALSWLTEEEQLLPSERLAVASETALSRPLPLTAERQTRVLLVTVVLVPALVLGAGLARSLVLRAAARRR